MIDPGYPDALPQHYRLHWYQIERVLGQGGFGITYLARDSNLERLVALKEYLPGDFAQRRPDATVRPRTEAQSERYRWGLERFLAEARTLARFEHPHIVRVHSVFEANETAYMVMRFEEGETLAALLERRGTLTEAELLRILNPVLDGLQLVHDAGFVHRDVQPENILIRRDGSPVLLDFGSARQALGRGKTMTVLVAPGYAPLEQYYGDAASQGPWSDIYGLGATCYRAVCGRAPLDAITRTKGVLGSAREVLEPAAVVARGRYSERLLAAIDHALELNEKGRPQSVTEWRREFEMPVATAQDAAVANPVVAAAPAGKPVGDPELRRPRRTTALWVIGSATVGAAAVAVVSGLMHPPSPMQEEKTGSVAKGSPPQPQPHASAAPSPAPVEKQPVPVESDVRADQLPDGQGAIAPIAATQELVKIPRVQVDGDKLKLKPPPRVPSTGKSGGAALPPAPADSQTHKGESKPPAPAPAKIGPDPPPATPTSSSVVIGAPSPASSPEFGPPGPALTPSPPPSSPPRPSVDQRLAEGQQALERGDTATALRLLKPLAYAGVPKAQALLGETYERGHGERSYFLAYVWYSLAIRHGQSAARSSLERVAARLQPAEIAQATQTIKAWKPQGDGESAER